MQFVKARRSGWIGLADKNVPRKLCNLQKSGRRRNLSLTFPWGDGIMFEVNLLGCCRLWTGPALL